MKLALASIDDTQLVALVEPDDSLVILGPGGQTELLAYARGELPAVPTDRVPRTEARLLSPVPAPPSIRDFFAFEAHMIASRASAKQEPDPGWYTQPFFYFTNPAAVTDPDVEITPPRGTRALDYELEVAAVIGVECSNLDPDDPATMDVIAGFTILNDWSARDIQGVEWKQNLGPQKGKDFATSVGPYLVTRDEFEWADPGRPIAPMTARVNGELWSSGQLADIHFSFAQLAAHASKDTVLRPGDLLGSGTCGTGCILELRGSGLRDTRHWLRAGDRVELEVGPLGVLANTVGRNPFDLNAPTTR